MKKSLKLFSIAIVLIVLLSFIAIYTVSRLSQHDYHLVDFDSEEAYKDMQFLTGIGPRVPGTDADLQGAEYVKERFTEAGLSDVHIEEYSVTTYGVNSASLSLITLDLGGQIVTDYSHIEDFILYQYSGSTNGDLRLEIVDVGNGSDENFQGVDVQGKAVLSTQQILPKAANNGASAVIVQNQRIGEELGYPPYCGGIYGSDGNGDSIPYPDAHQNAVVPTCCVSWDVGEEIRSAIEGSRELPVIGMSTVWIEMNFDTTIQKNPIYNVIGDVKGSSDDIIYIVAHRDTTYINPGAVDNTVGTVTIMEMARQIAGLDVGKTIRFISMDAEEKGLLGATEYVKAHEEEVIENGVICMNFDMNDVNLERVDTLELQISNSGYQNRLKEIKDLMFNKHSDLKDKYNINITEGGGGPDGAPFFKRGIDASFAMGEWGSSWEFHTQWDTIEHVNKESWQLSGIIFGTLALDIAGLK
jgi:hypothetical protein